MKPNRQAKILELIEYRDIENNYGKYIKVIDEE
jgi:hypothetical protein